MIKSVMTPFPYSVNTDDRLSTALDMMSEHDIRHLPVKEEGQLVSVITDSDIVRLMEMVEDKQQGQERKVQEACEQEVYIVNLTERLDAVLLHMARSHIDCTLVTKQDRLVGIFTMRDACRCYGEFLRKHFSHGDGHDAA